MLGVAGRRPAPLARSKGRLRKSVVTERVPALLARRLCGRLAAGRGRVIGRTQYFPLASFWSVIYSLIHSHRLIAAQKFRIARRSALFGARQLTGTRIASGLVIVNLIVQDCGFGRTDG
jgi:hypothetical protein